MPSQVNIHAEVSERSLRIFKSLVERYIADGQPVGSRTLARDTGLDISPATVRNVMADLEDLGLIASPHTSAGRVPTVKGYRFFIDTLLTLKDPSDRVIKRIGEELTAEPDLKRMLERASDVLSELTRFAGIVMVPKTEHKALRHVEFLILNERRVLAILVLSDGEVQNRIVHTGRSYTRAELEQAANYLNVAFAGKELSEVRTDLVKEMAATKEEMTRMMQAVVEMAEKSFGDGGDDYLLTGQTRLMEVSELSDVDKLRQLFNAFNEKRDILHLLEQALSGQGIQIFVGEESGYAVLDNCSVVTSTYEMEGQTLGVLGIIGPTRMAYERVIPVVDLTAKLLSSALKSRH
jgi:heat-inducible transcriptional repressor